ncbi:MAG: enoyl-CoA hydratase [Myxococcota bacterium]
MAGKVRVQREGGIGWVVFEYPERRNAITEDMWEAIPEAALELNEDPAVRVVVLRGAGEVAFVSGADISEFDRRRNASNSSAYDELNGRAFAALIGIDKPEIAMIHGFCVGGGAAIALCADLRYAADDVEFGIPAARLGLGYSAGGVAMLLRLVGPAVASEILFTARRLRADEALRVGLLNAVHPKSLLEARVKATAESIAGNAPLAVCAAKQAVRDLGQPESAREPGRIHAAVRACLESDDYQEGIRAFLEKRRPDFRGV